MSLAGLGFILFPEPILRLYTTDPAVIAAGVAGIRVVGLGQPLQAAAFVLGGALRGAGDTRTTLLVGGVSMWGVRLTCAYVFGLLLGWGIPGIWIGWSADWCVRGVALSPSPMGAGSVLPEPGPPGARGRATFRRAAS
jgi:Na+-driven multidrug efflux pump